MGEKIRGQNLFFLNHRYCQKWVSHVCLLFISGDTACLNYRQLVCELTSMCPLNNKFILQKDLTRSRLSVTSVGVGTGVTSVGVGTVSLLSEMTAVCLVN